MNNDKNIAKFKVKPRTTLLTTILNDLKYLNLHFNNENDLIRLKTIASNKKTWKL